MMVIFFAAFPATTVADPVGETRAENEAKALAQHNRLDANHDGFVTYAEMLAASLAMIMPKAQISEQLPCQPGAACSTARYRSGSALKRDP